VSRPPAVLLNVAAPWDGPDPVDVAARAAAAGLDGVGLVDSPRLFRDGLVETARVLAATPARLAGPCVTSLGLRHPATVAGALRTLEEHAPGRVLAVLGRGESSVRNEGLPLPSLAEYTAALESVRAALGGSLAAGSGRLLGAASGPRTLGVTARALGGVLVDVGVDPGVVTRAVEVARAEEPATAVWLFLRAALTASEEAAAAAAEPTLGSCAVRVASAPGWYGVSGAELDAVRALAADHDYARHGSAGARGGRRGGADRSVRDRFFLTGSADDVADRLRPLAGLGVAGVVLAGAVPGVGDRPAELAAAVRDGLTGRGGAA
jgi:alkanesulfonate monooxygenase SsuD/methylene tetrahydromethanopterin reductase-like flavin-dependent oxidoreductase (luciferase family)